MTILVRSTPEMAAAVLSSAKPVEAPPLKARLVELSPLVMIAFGVLLTMVWSAGLITLLLALLFVLV